MQSIVNKNILANFIGSFISGLLLFICVPFYVSYLGVESYALIGLFTTFIAISAVLDLGMSPTIMREMSIFLAGDKKKSEILKLLRTLEIITFFFAGILIIIFYLSADYIALEYVNSKILSSEIVKDALILMGIATCLRFIEGFYRSAIYGLEKQVWFNSFYAIIQFLRFAGVLFVLEFLSTDIKSFFIWQIGISILSIIVLIWKVYSILPKINLKISFSLSSAMEVKNFAGGMFMISITALLWKQADQLFIFALIPLEEFGNFMLAVTLCSALVLVAAPVTQAYFPRIVKLLSNGDEPEILQSYRFMSQVINTLIGSAVIIICFYSYEIVLFWTSDHSIAMNIYRLVFFLSISSLIISMLYPPYNFLVAQGRTKHILALNIMGLIIILPSIFIFLPLYGLLSIILIKLFIDFIRFLFYSKVINSQINSYTLLQIYKDSTQPLIGPLFLVYMTSLYDLTFLTEKFYFIVFLIFIYLGCLTIAVLSTGSLRGPLLTFLSK